MAAISRRSSSSSPASRPTSAPKPTRRPAPALADVDPNALVEVLGERGRGAAALLASPSLDGAQRRFLRGLGHRLQPIVQVGHHGLTSALASAINEQLEQHELIKVKVMENAVVSVELAALWLHRTLGAQVAQILGRTVLLYRPRQDQPTIRLPRA